jgi:PAS domain S-box-containing protein
MQNKATVILAIDDNQDNLVVLKVLLSETFPNATLITAQSGKKGIELCKTHKPDVVLLDIAMPNMDGYEVCAELKSDNQIKHIPVVMLTATAINARSRILSMEAGADAFLAKPIDESELTAQIRAMLRIKESEDLKISEKERLEILVQQRTIELERELNEHKKTEKALQQTVNELEQSRGSEMSLLYDLRAEIVVRKDAEEQVLAHLKEQRIISEFSRALVLIYSKEEIYEYIGKRIFEVAGDAYVLVVKSDAIDNTIRISQTFGLDDMIEKVREHTGFEALNFKISISNLNDEQKALYYSKELVLLPEKSLYTLAAHTVDEELCKTIEMMAGIKKVYTIGFTLENQLYGGIAILCKNNCNISQVSLIENLTNLASVALQRLNAEEQLQKEHDNLDAILSSSPVGMLVIDENEQIVSVNRAASRLFQQDMVQKPLQRCGEFIGCKNSYENHKGCGYSSACNACKILESIHSTILTKQNIQNQEAEILTHTPEGTSTLWLQYSTESLILNEKKHIILSLNNITERKKAEKEKMQTEKRYKSLIEHAPDGIVLIGLDGAYKYASSSALKIFGYEKEDILINSPFESTHPNDRPKVVELLNDLIQNPSKIPTMEYRFQKKDGSWRWIQSTFSNLLSDPSVEAIVINFRDITERVEAQEAVKESETKYRELFDANKDGILIFYINPDNTPGKFVEVNKAACEMLGYTAEEFLNFTNIELEVNENAASLQQMEKEINEKGFASRETRIRHRNGSLIDVEVLVILIHYNEKLALMNIVRDISERKHAAEAIQEREEQLSTLINTSSDIICFKDGEGRWLRANKAMLEVFHLNDPYYQNKNDEELASISAWFLKTSFLNSRSSNEKAWRSKETIFEEETIPSINQNNRTYEVAKTPLFHPDGSRKGLVVFGRDITKRKQDEEDLRESRQQLLDIIDFLPDATFVINNDKKVIAWNKAMEEMTGISKNEMIGQGDHAYTIPFYGRRQLQLMDLIDKPDDELKVRYQNFRRKGDSIYAEIFAPELYNKQGAYISNVAAPIFNGNGKRIGSIESIRDVSFIKKAETALKESEEKYRIMVDLLPDSVFIHDGENVFFANAATCRMIGIESLEEVSNKTIFDFIHPDHKNKLRKRVKEIFLSGRAAKFTEFKFLNTKGEEIDVESIGIPVTFMGKPAIQAIARDITERKKAEREIMLKDELLHLTGEMAKVGGWELDVATQKRTWTREAAKIFDIEMEHLNQINTVADKFDFVSLLKIKTALNNAVKKGIPYDMESELTSVTGVKKWVRILGVPVKSGEKVIKVRGIYQDLSDRKAAEIILETERMRLRTLIKTIPDLIWLKDTEGKYLLCNPTYEKYCGVSETDIIGKTDFDLELPELAEAYTKQDQQAIITGKPLVYQEWMRIIATGQQRLMDTSKTPMYNSKGKLIGVLGVARDITEVYQSHESLRKSEANIRSLVENTDASIWSIDDNFRLIDANAHFYERNRSKEMGVSIKPGDDVLDLLTPQLRESWKQLYMRALKGESFSVEMATVPPLEMQVKQYSFNPIITSDGKMIGITIFGHNITEIKKAQEEINLLNAELEQRVILRTNQLEIANKELEAFSYSVSHDLRAPLRGIDGWSLALLEDNGSQIDSQGHIYLDRVRSEAQRMGHLIDDLLKLSRVSRFEMKREVVNLSSIAQTIVNRLTEAHPRRQFEIKIQPDLTVIGDPAMLEIVLTNLLDNAAKFTGKKPFAHIEFGTTIAEGQQSFYVRDNGAGFDMENAKNLFGAFQRMHKQTEFQGTGVGLATVQRIIHRHGGKIWADSKSDHGTTFYFTVNVLD